MLSHHSVKALKIKAITAGQAHHGGETLLVGAHQRRESLERVISDALRLTLPSHLVLHASRVCRALHRSGDVDGLQCSHALRQLFWSLVGGVN